MSRKTVRIEIREDKTEEVMEAMHDALKTAMEACGIQAEAHAVNYITSQGAVDTGLLRNSITSVIGGEKPKKPNAHGDNPSKYGKKQAIPFRPYNGTAPADPEGKVTVYIGSNVEYAPYVEMGTQNGRHRMAARPYLKPAVDNHQDEYKRIIQEILSK